MRIQQPGLRPGASTGPPVGPLESARLPAALVVEDESGVAATLAAILEDEGYRVDVAANLSGALDLTGGRRFDAALIDLHLGTGSGLDVLRRLKETSPAAVAIVVTADATLESAIGAMGAGAHAYLLKPTDLEALKRALAEGRDRVARAFAAERAAGERMRRLQEATAALASAFSPVEAARIVAEQGAAALGATRASVHLIGEDASALETVHLHGYPPGALERWRRVSLDQPLPTSDAIRTGRPVLVGSRVELAARYPSLGRAEETVSHAWACVPVLLDERPVGVLNLAFPAPRALSEPEVDLLVLLARQCAHAVDRARLYAAESASRARAERAAETGQRLQAITVELSRSLDPTAVLDQVVEAASRLLDAQVAAVFLLERAPEPAEASEFVLAAAHGIDPARAAGLRLPRWASVAGRALAAGRALIVDDVSVEPGAALPRLVTGQTSGSEIAAPVIAGEEWLGVVKVFSSTPHRFSPADADLLTALGAAAAVAIANARRHQETAEAVRARDTFLSIAAHELKTPLTAVVGNVQLLARTRERGGLSEERLDRLVRAIGAGTVRLAGLVDDLLDVSRIRTGLLELRLASIDLRVLVEAAVERLQVRLDDGHPVDVDLIPPTCSVEGDGERLAQVVDNLLDNAVKYSPDGGTVRVGLAIADGEATLSVGDEGIGLTPGATERIFEPFGRAENAAAAGIPGMGLGLHICREIVERHGGRIEAESPGEGRGTTFRVTLPCRPDEGEVGRPD